MSKAVGGRQERMYEDMAVQAIMDVRAMNEKNVDVDLLTGKKGRKNKEKVDGQKEDGGRRVVSTEEKKAELGSLEKSLGKAVSK